MTKKNYFLDPIDREICRLLNYEGLNQSQVAKELGCTRQRVSQRIGRMRDWGVPNLPKPGRCYKVARGPSRAWSSEDLDILKTMHQNLETSEDIVEVLDRTVNSVNTMIFEQRRLGIEGFYKKATLKSWSEEEIDILVNLYNANCPNDYIVDIIGRSVYDCRQKTNELVDKGILKSKIYKYDEVKWEVLEHRSNGLDNLEIAAKLGRSVMWVNLINKKLKREGIAIPPSPYRESIKRRK